MTWESAVIIGLCAYSAVTTTGIYLRLRRLAPVDAIANPISRGPLAIGSEIPMRGGKAIASAIDNGSVILMTSERDARLLQDEDD